MGLGSRVLVATDLSDAADEAIRQGYERARAEDGDLVVCHVVPAQLFPEPLFPQRNVAETERVLTIQKEAIRALEQRVSALLGLEAAPLDAPRVPGARTFSVVVDTGNPEAAIVRAADSVGATMVAVSSRGAGGLDRILLGSVASRVVRYAHCPVLVARPHDKTGKVLAATDFSEPAVPAVAVAAEEARLRGARLTLLHSIEAFPSPTIGWGAPFGASWVVPPPELVESARKAAEEALRSTLQRFSIDGDVMAPIGNPESSILEAARTLPAELIVLSTRGRTGLSRMVLGSVADRVVSHAPCSVLAVRVAHPA